MCVKKMHGKGIENGLHIVKEAFLLLPY